MNEHYIINVICSCGGFASQLNFILSWLTAIDGKNHKLTIAKYPCPFEHCIWNKTVKNINIWDKIFKPIVITHENVIDLPKVISCNTKHKNFVKNSVCHNSWDRKRLKKFNMYNLKNDFKIPFNINISLSIFLSNFREIRLKLNNIYKKYLIPQPLILNKLLPFLHFFENNYVIGLHIRTSQHYNLEQKYTTMDIVDNYIKEIKKINKLENYKIFTATSNNNIIEKLKENFGKDNIFYQNTIRDNNDINEKNIKEALNNDWSKNQNYLNKIKKYGIVNYYSEVYLDILLLSKCNIIIGGPSNIFLNALILNPLIEYKIPEILLNSGCK